MKKLVLMLVAAGIGLGSAFAADDNQAMIDRIKPVGQVHVKGAAAAGSGGARTGQQVYQSSCVGCHASKALGAPLSFSKAEWQPRIDARGLDKLLEHALKGFNAMPPMGACSDCSEDEIKAAIDYMLEYN
ncbi:c-type cytochrome [Paraneptunicella aestuarii]|uniref:c-type cytochrome n=1 Tax=Paraneptunicella aestuarii TaxID=2831148 RepID=UPI001E2A9962|nr:c-type cytochrome [Paraneptunicella aestuarii]